jgi:hypothetical protein
MTREEALHSLQEAIRNEDVPPREFDDFLDFFNLSAQDVANEQGKSHLDYISEEDTRIKESLMFKLLAFPWKCLKTVRR